MVRQGFFFPGQNEKGPDHFQAFPHVGKLADGAEAVCLFCFVGEIGGGDAAEAGGDFTQYLFARSQA